jgi:signal transduction histidine kinase
MPENNSERHYQHHQEQRAGTKPQLCAGRTNLEKVTDERNDARDQLSQEQEKFRASEASLQRAHADLAEEKAEHRYIKETLTTRDEFLAIVSHDLRAPLSVMAMSADELLELGDAVGEGVLRRELVTMIRRNASTMERLISDLLDVERIASNKLLLTMTPRDLNDLAREAVENFRPISIAKSVSLNTQLSSDPMMAQCDSDRMMQVFANLLSNAIKFTPSGGAIWLESRHNGSHVQVSVSDSGPGIPEDQRLKVFERYGQVDRKDRQGLGLGLYISKWLVGAHAGLIWVESSLSKGSRFCFELPSAV